MELMAVWQQRKGSTHLGERKGRKEGRVFLCFLPPHFFIPLIIIERSESGGESIHSRWPTGRGRASVSKHVRKKPRMVGRK